MIEQKEELSPKKEEGQAEAQRLDEEEMMRMRRD